MEKRKGFLLIEFIVSFGILSFVILLFTQFFLLVVGSYQDAHERLKALQAIQNSIEEAWKGNQPSGVRVGKVDIQVKQWPVLAIVPSDLPYSQLSVVYQAFQASKQTNKVILSMPGYLYETASS